MEEDIESEEDSENELSKEYRQIQGHLMPKSKNGLEDILPFGQSGMHLIDTGRGTDICRLCMLRSIRLATPEIMENRHDRVCEGEMMMLQSIVVIGLVMRLAYMAIIRLKRSRYICISKREMISSRAT